MTHRRVHVRQRRRLARSDAWEAQGQRALIVAPVTQMQPAAMSVIVKRYTKGMSSKDDHQVIGLSNLAPAISTSPRTDAVGTGAIKVARAGGSSVHAVGSICASSASSKTAATSSGYLRRDCGCPGSRCADLGVAQTSPPHLRQGRPRALAQPRVAREAPLGAAAAVHQLQRLRVFFAAVVARHHIKRRSRYRRCLPTRRPRNITARRRREGINIIRSFWRLANARAPRR